jgi:hypothetical protein
MNEVCRKQKRGIFWIKMIPEKEEVHHHHCPCFSHSNIPRIGEMMPVVKESMSCTLIGRKRKEEGKEEKERSKETKKSYSRLMLRKKQQQGRTKV